MWKVLGIIFISLLILILLVRYLLSPYLVNKAPKTISFKALILPTSPNYYLVCPVNYCKPKPQKESPVFNVSLENLIQEWQSMIQKQSQVNLLKTRENNTQQSYVQFSKLWGFPDMIYVEFIPLTNNRSTMAIYSHSLIGRYDFEVNKNRIHKWFTYLHAQL